MLSSRMIALGVYVLISVAAAAPAHADDRGPNSAKRGPEEVSSRGEGKLASMYEDAACDLSDMADSGECAVEIELSMPPATAILDCENPLLHDMIGSCDNPKPTLPTLHVATVRNGNGISVARTSTGDHLTVVAAAFTLDAALPWRAPTLALFSRSAAVVEFFDAAISEVPAFRLERPPRV